MGLLNFFKKAGGWIKDKFHKAKDIVTKFAKPVINVVKKGVDFVSKTPLAPIINKATGGIFDTVKNVVNLIPDGKVKENVTNFTNKAEQFKNQAVNKVDELQNKFNTTVDRGKQIAGTIANGLGRFANASFKRPLGVYHPKVM